MGTEISETESSIGKRTLRAATESMTVVDLAEAGEYKVYSGTSSVYEVDLVERTCTCPAAKYQPGACKHVRRIELETGLREIPDLGRRTDVELMADASKRRKDEQTVATDGGVVADAEPRDSEPEIPHAADYSPKKARELTHSLAMDVAAGGNLRDWREHRAVVDVLWSALDVAVRPEVER